MHLHHRHHDPRCAADLGPDELADPAARWAAFGEKVRGLAREFAGRDDWLGGGQRGPRGPHPEHGLRGPRGRFGRGGRFFDNGVLRLVVLALIVEQPRHGYEIIKEIEDKTGGAYAPSAGVIYPTLTLLEETGQIEVVSAEANKKLYAATEAGRATVEENRAVIDAVLARFAEAGADRRQERDPRLIRAVENLRLALRLRTEGGNLSADQVNDLAALLDDTARKIEQL